MRGAIEKSAAPRRGEQGVLDATMERCETPSPSHAATQTGKRSWDLLHFELKNQNQDSQITFNETA